MSSATVKARLKSSRDAIKNEDWAHAAADAQTVLEHEPDNYNALVFRALALLRLNDYDASENAYRRATQLQPDTPLAWQGLEKFYDERGQLERSAECALTQAHLFRNADDATKCAEALQRHMAAIADAGSTAKRSHALQLWLPSSPFHPLLSTLPVPDQSAPKATSTFDAQMAVHANSLHILHEIIGLEEALEQHAIDAEVDRRRSRIDQAGKSRARLQKEVGIEHWTKSKLPDLYDQLTSHPRANDEHRREAESKLLAYRHRLLLALPSPATQAHSKAAAAQDQTALAKARKADDEMQRRKRELRDQVATMARGMVTIDVPDELAWTIALEWTDIQSLVDLDRRKMRAYVHLFPRSPKSSSFRALLLLLRDEQFAHEDAERKKERDVDAGEEEADPLSLAIDGLEGSPNSLLAYRIASTLYLLDGDYASAAELALAASNLLSVHYEREAGVELPLSKVGLAGVLAAAYARLFPPLHHAKALRYADTVLGHDGDDVDATLVRAYVAQAAGRWDDAHAGFARVLELSTRGTRSDEDDDRGGSRRRAAQRVLSVSEAPDLEARAEMAWCDVHRGRLASAADQLRSLVGDVDGERADEVGAEERARTWWRLGRCLWDLGGDNRTDTSKAFTCFITCLKRQPSFAPAYTSLGIFYDTVPSPPNADRAAKCFQKAFELDARETVAARRLAEGFADEREWDLVEVVARRVVEGEGADQALLSSSSSSSAAGSSASSAAATSAAARRHTTHNAWAWKALGRVELGRGGRFEQAIVALQIAIRAEPDDVNAWHVLGEAYAASGRQVAALKSFEKALELIRARAASGKDGADAGAEARWETRYSAAQVHRELGDYEQAIRTFEAILVARPAELAVRIAFAETLLARGGREHATHHVARAEDSLARAIEAAHEALKAEPHLRSAWKIVADATFRLARLGSLGASSLASDLPTLIGDLLSLAGKDDIDGKMAHVAGGITLQRAQAELQATAPEKGWRPAAALFASVFFFKARVVYNAGEDDLAAGAWGDLAGALYALTRRRGDGSALVPELDSLSAEEERAGRAVMRQAIGCLRQAIRLRPRNELFWLALGNLTFEHSAKVAQHCFIKAIELRPKSPIPWSNLGFLYLQQRDVQLANEAFLRAQTLEPDWAPAWAGQALVAKAHDDIHSARALYEHAAGLSEGGVLEADYGFARSVFDLLGAGGTPSSRTSPASSGAPLPPLAQLYSPAFALSAYLSHAPDDATALHLGALFAERLGQSALAIARIERCASLLEQAYERRETARIARMYAIAEANLGRMRLGCGGEADARGAITAFETALALLEDGGVDEDDEEGRGVDEGGDEEEEEEEEEGDQEGSWYEPLMTPAKRARVRLQAHLGIGLAHYFLNEHDEARSKLEATLASLSDEAAAVSEGGGDWSEVPIEQVHEARAQVCIVLSRVLWALGTAEAHEAAKACLLDCIALAPRHLGLVVSLAAAGAVSGDEDLMEAALAEVGDLRHGRLGSDGRTPGQADVGVDGVGDGDSEGHIDFVHAMAHFVHGRTQAGLDALRASAGGVGGNGVGSPARQAKTDALVQLASALGRLAYVGVRSSSAQTPAQEADADKTKTQGEEEKEVRRRRALNALRAAREAVRAIVERAPWEGGARFGEEARWLALALALALARVSFFQGQHGAETEQKEGGKEDGDEKERQEGGGAVAVEWAQRAVVAAPWEASHWEALTLSTSCLSALQ